MATRRTHISEKAATLPEDRIITPSSPATNSNISPAVPMSVIIKLLFFTALMITLPIGSFFALRDSVFGGNSTYAGATAAVVANLVLVAYIVVAVLEDQGEEPEKSANKQWKDKKGE